MNEADCAEVLLLRAIETTPHAAWSDEDAAWASRVAREQLGAQAAAPAFLLARTCAAWQRLGPREPALARWRRWAHPRHGAALALLTAAAGLAGLLADPVGRTQRIDLLAPPVWAVLAWNLAVYAALALGRLLRGGRPGGLRRALARWRQRLPAGGGPFGRFAADWWPRAAPLNAARIALALHLAAAMLALGLIAGLYLRGLVLDYRVGWQSTFLDAGAVRAVLSVAFAPALALSGQALPDVAGIAALREPGADLATASAASAAPWIHLLALTLALLVVAPRGLLALGAALQMRRQRVELPLDEPYFRRLLAWQRSRALRLRLIPYAQAPDAAAVDALRALLIRTFGDSAAIQLEATVAFGDEDRFALAPADGTWCVALFDLGATPEAENHGRFLQRLAAGGPFGVWVDEAAFRQRFGERSARLPARREAWAALAAAHGARAAFIDTRHPDAQAIEAALGALTA